MAMVINAQGTLHPVTNEMSAYEMTKAAMPKHGAVCYACGSGHIAEMADISPARIIKQDGLCASCNEVKEYMTDDAWIRWVNRR